MKYFLVSLVLANITPLVISLSGYPDCGACKDNCKWWDVKCAAYKRACKSWAGPFQTFTAGVEATCNNDSIRMQKRELIEEAKDLLVCMGFYTQEEVDRPKYRFCNGIGVWGANEGGMSPAWDKVLFHGNWRFVDAQQLSVLMAHELYHIKQYENWGSEGFACRYAVQISKGKGYGKSNSVERTAYTFDKEVSNCLSNGEGCPLDCKILEVGEDCGGGLSCLPGLECRDFECHKEVQAVLRDVGLEPTQLLDVCEGDCDTDDDCKDGLTCFHRYEDDPNLGTSDDIVPGCCGTPTGSYDYCVKEAQAVLRDVGPEPTQLLDVCEGDCDTDEDCKHGLKCFHRYEDDPNLGTSDDIVPGCRGTPTGSYDYCVKKAQAVLRDVGPDPTQLLGVCEGDCDTDEDCKLGLMCFHRYEDDPNLGTSDDVVPGCCGTPTGSYDYCVTL